MLGEVGASTKLSENDELCAEKHREPPDQRYQVYDGSKSMYFSLSLPSYHQIHRPTLL
eukprot:CAMPEP_0113572124 /NCGR_PEP_ID=MMETSP0015_2-20120614/25927_1 /TAXON_ID=2838 /ORGANISM="Odontella" /LENGTH=57 /DNA_ID=CAMNT_0000475135 /DNA_START=1 /DNA_END=170 /DNA_ORIENTATION=- /assembly_acc=CAM_ASM_000160